MYSFPSPTSACPSPEVRYRPIPRAGAAHRVQFRQSMRLWQHRARLVVAVIGIGSAIAVYAAMKERETPTPAPAPTRIDPAAVIESTGNVVQQVRGTKQDFLIKAEQQLTYEGGATKLMGVAISVSNRGGRDFVIRAHQAQAGERQQELHLQGEVHLSSSDGFELTTAEAFFSEANGQMRAPGTFTFSRRLLVGSGTGMTYDRTTDVLSIVSAADIRLTDDGGNTLTQFRAGNAVFTRPQHLIVLGDTVHVLHNDQVADASRASAYLSEDDSVLRRVELREKAEVSGGGEGIERLRAMAIDLDYAGDGQHLSHVLLNGDAAVSSAGGGGRAGRDVRGTTIDLLMAQDGTLSRMTAREAVQLTLPGQQGAASRTIEARQLEADGLPGGGLSAARFDGAVTFREAAPNAAPRIVRSRALRVSLEEDEIDSATFSGAVRFEEEGLLASGATMAYAPAAGSLIISGTDTGGGPRVSDEQVSVEAGRITVQIDSRDMTATGGARTTLRPRAPAPNPAGRPGGTQAGTKLPGLFEQGTAANGNGDTFEYSGSGGQASYVGNATLWQAETTVRGDRIAIDQRSGDLRVTGAARSVIKLANGSSSSRSTTLSYVDRDRTISYQGDASNPAQLNSPDNGDLRAGRILVTLATASNRVDQLEAATGVTLKLDTRTATGAELVYRAEDERYVMTGTGRTPVKIVENCRETTGSTLTFYKSADRIVIDGNKAARTQSIRGQQCSEPQRR